MSRIRTGVIGVGHFGQFHADKYAGLDRSDLVAVVDIDHARAVEVAARHGVEALTDYRELLGRVDAVSIAVPTAAHYEVAKACLESGVNVLLEKPMADDLGKADDLIRVAARSGRILQVGHLERFSAARLAVNAVIHDPRFIECNRIASFKPRGTDVNVILDLMIHDIDLILDLVKSPVERLEAVGAPVLTPEEDMAYVFLRFESGCVATITASRVSLKNERKMRIFQPDTYVSIDFLDRKVTVMHKGREEMFPGVPRIEVKETTYDEGDSLEREVAAFLDCVAAGGTPPVTAEDGRQALETALEITRRLRPGTETSAVLSQPQAPPDARRA